MKNFLLNKFSIDCKCKFELFEASQSEKTKETRALQDLLLINFDVLEKFNLEFHVDLNNETWEIHSFMWNQTEFEACVSVERSWGLRTGNNKKTVNKSLNIFDFFCG